MQHIKVRAVEGRRVLDQRTLGRQHHFIGYTRDVDPKPKTVLGNKEVRRITKFVGGESIVTETRDAFYRRAILDGDLEYIEHVDDAGKRTHLDKQLTEATKKHALARKAAAAAAADAAARAADDAADETTNNTAASSGDTDA